MGSFSLPWPFGKRGVGAPGGTGAGAGGGVSWNRRQSGDSSEERRLEEFGVTPQLLDFVKGFTAATFRDSPLQGESLNGSSDLTEWRERHATLVLSKVKEISQLRYILCPRHLKEDQFWRIYFLLVKSYVAPYEIRAIQKAKLAMMGLENGKSVGKGSIEVEMTVTKDASNYSDYLPGMQTNEMIIGGDEDDSFD